MSPLRSSSYVFNIALVFYLNFVRGRVRRYFLLSNASRVNTVLCRGSHWPWATGCGPGVVNIAGLTRWLLFSRYLLLCMLHMNHDFPMADLNNNTFAFSFALDSENLHWKCTTQPSVTMSWGEHKYLSGFLDSGESMVDFHRSYSKICEENS